jgi:hypothetical protein
MEGLQQEPQTFLLLLRNFVHATSTVPQEHVPRLCLIPEGKEQI